MYGAGGGGDSKTTELPGGKTQSPCARPQWRGKGSNQLLRHTFPQSPHFSGGGWGTESDERKRWGCEEDGESFCRSSGERNSIRWQNFKKYWEEKWADMKEDFGLKTLWECTARKSVKGKPHPETRRGPYISFIYVQRCKEPCGRPWQTPGGRLWGTTSWAGLGSADITAEMRTWAEAASTELWGGGVWAKTSASSRRLLGRRAPNTQTVNTTCRHQWRTKTALKRTAPEPGIKMVSQQIGGNCSWKGLRLAGASEMCRRNGAQLF